MTKAKLSKKKAVLALLMVAAAVFIIPFAVPEDQFAIISQSYQLATVSLSRVQTTCGLSNIVFTTSYDKALSELGVGTLTFKFDTQTQTLKTTGRLEGPYSLPAPANVKVDWIYVGISIDVTKWTSQVAATEYGKFEFSAPWSMSFSTTLGDSWSGSGTAKVVVYNSAPTPTSTPTPTTPTTTPTKPPTVSFWDSLNAIFSEIWTFIKSIFGLRLVPSSRLEVVTGDLAYGGDTYQHTFTLKNKLTRTVPDSDYSDGTVSYLRSAWMVVDKGGTIVYKGDVSEISTLSAGAAKEQAASWQVPTSLPAGKYAVTAVLLEIPMHFDKTKGAWVEDPTVIVDQQAVELNVRQIATPTAPADIWTRITTFWTNLWNWLKSLFW